MKKFLDDRRCGCHRDTDDYDLPDEYLFGVDVTFTLPVSSRGYTTHTHVHVLTLSGDNTKRAPYYRSSHTN